MSTHIGIIAEDDSDVETLYELTCKLTRENSFKFSKFVGRGCSKMRRKCRPWAENLRAKGCEHLVVVHDLDDRDKVALRVELEPLIAGAGFKSTLVLIPIREMEAWLLCDRSALKEVFNAARLPKVPANPEVLDDPKSELARRVKAAGGSLYIHTVHNKKIAKELEVQLVQGHCHSFEPYVTFIQDVVGLDLAKRSPKQRRGRTRRITKR